MKKLIITLSLAIFIITGCKSKKYEPKDIYEQCFLNYVKTDFGKPSDFIEITKSFYDTIDMQMAFELLDLYEEIIFILPEHKQDELRDIEKRARESKGVIHIIYKVRMKQGKDEIVVNTFFGTYDFDTQECTFGDNESDFHIMPKVYEDLLNFSKDFLTDTKINDMDNRVNYFSI